MKFKTKTDATEENLQKLIELYDTYRQMQYDIFKQYNLIMEDPILDELYIDLTTLTTFKGYIEDDLNGVPEKRSSTTEIIRDFKKFIETYKTALNSMNAPQSDYAGN